MKKSFTLLEVIISVVILAIVGVALLKNGGDNIENLNKIEKKEKFVQFINLVSNHRREEYNHLSKHLEDFLHGYYAIDDLEFLKVLKDTKFKYSENVIKIKTPKLESFEDEDSSDDKQEDNILNIDFIKLSIHNKEGGEYLYLLELYE